MDFKEQYQTLKETGALLLKVLSSMIEVWETNGNTLSLVLFQEEEILTMRREDDQDGYDCIKAEILAKAWN